MRRRTLIAFNLLSGVHCRKVSISPNFFPQGLLTVRKSRWGKNFLTACIAADRRDTRVALQLDPNPPPCKGISLCPSRRVSPKDHDSDRVKISKASFERVYGIDAQNKGRKSPHPAVVIWASGNEYASEPLRLVVGLRIRQHVPALDIVHKKQCNEFAI